MSTVLVDVTQFCRQPARSGVQRALAELARHWPADLDARFVSRQGGELQAVEPLRFASAADAVLGSPPSADDGALVAAALRGRPVSAADQRRAVVVLPEPTYDAEVLGHLEQRLRERRPVLAVAYDCLPMTAPWAFPGNGQALTSRYFRLLAAATRAVATSDAVHEVLTARLRRDPAATPTCWLGVDHLAPPPSARRAPEPWRFLVVGTVEPRKRVPLAAAAVARLREQVPDAQLVVVGRAGCEEPRELRLLEGMHRRGEVEWLSDASDEDLRRELGRAAALLSLGEEGFGLPVVEAAGAGCPVLYAGVQPAAGLLRERGAWPVAAGTAQELADELLRWGPDRLAAARDQVTLEGLPTWRDFARQVGTQAQGLAAAPRAAG